MAKMIVVIDVGPSRPDRPVCGTYEQDAYRDVFESELKGDSLVGKMVSFDEAYLRRDPEDDSFLLAEFRGWED